MYPMISLIETSALQKLCQRYCPYKAQQCPGKSDVKIKVLAGSQPDDGTETYYNDTQNINSHGSIGGTGATAYSVQAQEAT